MRPLALTTPSFPLLHEELIIPTAYKNISLADMWKDIQGANSWNGLLDPINAVLKAEILRYGDFSELCYDAFDSKLSMNDYSPDQLFRSCEMAGNFSLVILIFRCFFKCLMFIYYVSFAMLNFIA
jgi:hypothetical protein